MRYTELLKEAPWAIQGDWQEGDAVIADQSLLVHQKYWRKVGTLSAGLISYDITQSRTSYLVGRQDADKDKFVVIARLELDPISNNPYGYPNLASVEQVVVRQTMRGFQVATQLYRFLIKSGITLLSDQSQYFGARRLWARLSRQVDMVVDVVDMQKSAVVAQSVQLHQGKIDSDFDTQHWSYDINAGKQNIRFALRDIASSSPSPLSVAPSP